MSTLGAKIINMILDYERINANQFAESIGLSRTQPIYDLINGKIKKVSINYAKKILEKYPYYSYNWLLTGEGEMLKGGNISGDRGVSNSGIISGAVVTGNNNKTGAVDPKIEILETEIEFLKQNIEEKERIIKEKERLLEEKERLIQILLKDK